MIILISHFYIRIASKSVHGHDTDAHAADENFSAASNCSSTVQLPANLLETHGLKVANRFKQYLASPDAIYEHGAFLPKNIQIHATRPLTCDPNIYRNGYGVPIQVG
jgi:hypothetical protein